MKIHSLRRWLPALGLLALAEHPLPARAMCGCMIPVRPSEPRPVQHVAERILNKASKVVLVRDGSLTTMTLSNDVLSDVDELGLIVPVPTVIKEKDVRVVEPSVFLALEALTNPRLVESHDPDPCVGDPQVASADEAKAERAPPAPAARPTAKAAQYGVKVEAHYDVGEYSIAILSAKLGAGAGLMKWLNKFHYEVPPEAVPVLDSYIKQKMSFFVARVNFKKLARRPGSRFLRPIQVRYATPKLMLPVRLGTINADGPQELVAYALSPVGRIEATNYKTLRMSTGQDLPLYVKDQLDQVYGSIFDHQTRREDMRVIFLEYVQRGALDARTAELVGLGWKPEGATSGAFDHFTLTRLHFRYDREHFPEDLVLQETADVEPFSVQYQVRHASANVGCEAGRAYVEGLPKRREAEALALAELTGGSVAEIREKMGLGVVAPRTDTPSTPPGPPRDGESFWKRLWKKR